MRMLVTILKLLTQATLVMLMLAMVRPASATSPLSPSGARGLAPNRIASHPVAPIIPIGVPTPFPVLPAGPVAAPGLSTLQATASSVTVQWSDTSNDELGFRVFRRDLSGNWQQVYQIGTRDVRGSGDTYSWVDTSTDLSGQCYMIAAYNANAVGSTAEECTVRPDPSRFPQAVPLTNQQPGLGIPIPPDHDAYWSGLSDTNDGTGELVNGTQQLQYADRTWGVNLAWANSSLWRVEAQGGPHLMKGQALALKVWGGGWLKYGNQTFGVDLQYSSTPVYEWYALGMQEQPGLSTYAGSSLTDGGFLLWNSAAKAYLVPGDQTWGVGLAWYRGDGVPAPTPTPSPSPTQHGVKTEQVFNCIAPNFDGSHDPVEVFEKDLTTGSGFVDLGGLNWQGNGIDESCSVPGPVPITFSPQPGHLYEVVATDSARDLCDSGNDPNNGGCHAMEVDNVFGDANGCTRADIVGENTQLSCPSAEPLRSLPTPRVGAPLPPRQARMP